MKGPRFLIVALGAVDRAERGVLHERAKDSQAYV